MMDIGSIFQDIIRSQSQTARALGERRRQFTITIDSDNSEQVPGGNPCRNLILALPFRSLDNFIYCTPIDCLLGEILF